MDSNKNFLAIKSRELATFGSTLPFYLGAFRDWYNSLLLAVKHTNIKQGLDKLDIFKKLDAIENIVFVSGSPYASGQTYEMYRRINAGGVESAFRPYRSDIEAFFGQINAVLTPFENFAAASVALFAGKINLFEDRKASMDKAIASLEPFSDAYNKALEEKKAYQKIDEIFGNGRATIEMYAYVMAKTYDYFNPEIMKVTINTTQAVEVVQSADKPQEIVTVSTAATDSTNKVVQAEALPKTQTGEVATTKAIDEATGNVVEIVTDKNSLPITKTVFVENTQTGQTETQALAVNEKGQPVAAVVIDSTGAPKTILDPVSRQEMPVVNTESVPVAVQQAVSLPSARIEQEEPLQNENTVSLATEYKPDLTKAGVAFGVCAALAIVGYIIIK